MEREESQRRREDVERVLCDRFDGDSHDAISLS